MKTTKEHEKYVNDLSSLMDTSGKYMSNFVMKIFKIALKQSRDSASFLKSVRSVKPRLIRATSKKAMATANKAFDLGKKFASEKVKK